ncbi:MAG: hypothetical protein ACREX0_02235 [Noviherbaspirillum sp.]
MSSKKMHFVFDDALKFRQADLPEGMRSGRRPAGSAKKKNASVNAGVRGVSEEKNCPHYLYSARQQAIEAG